MTVTSSDRPIQFPCHCGHRFAVEADRAGGTVQCPDCGLLCDIPTLSELDNLSDDGTLLLKPATVKPEPSRVAVVDRHFGPSRLDKQGNEIDLRNTQDDFLDVGAPTEAGTIPAGKEDARPAKPKYDPVTGELIRPMQLAKRPDIDEAKKVPVAKRALTYAAWDTARTMTARRIFVQLFMPTNIVVMTFIFIFYLLFQLPSLLGLAIFAMIGLMPSLYNLPLAFLLMAHYVNTLEDNGPDAIDELPRPMRNLSFADDFLRPFSNMLIALVYCFAPALFCLALLPHRAIALSLLPAALGFLFFPAALLTTTAAGALRNLRLDRMAAIIRIAGGQYLLSFVVWFAGLILFAFSLFGPWLVPSSVRPDWLFVLNKPVIQFPMLFGIIILNHFSSWHLGLIYRRYHEEFPWVLQKHVSQRREAEAKKAAEIRAMRRKPRYVEKKE